MTKIIHLLINLLLILASLTYPIGLLLFPESPILKYIIIVIAVCWIIKAIQTEHWKRYFSILMSIILTLTYFTQTLTTMYWYPVIINIVMLITFGGSLWSKQSLIERFARLKTPNLSQAGIIYTRKVTQIWCLFFILNILICVILISLKEYEWWALYTGIISYILMGLLIVSERLFRKIVMKK